MRVFVLLFNARTENEGIHTIQIQDPERGERNVVLMFESEDDATRFGLLLEAQDFPTPTVEAFELEEIEEFCRGADYDCNLVPEDTLAMPLNLMWSRPTGKKKGQNPPFPKCQNQI